MKNSVEELDLQVINHGNFFELSNKAKCVLIVTKEYSFGSNVFLGERVKICNQNGGPADFVVFGDNVQIHHDSTIMVSSLSVLDYTKINNNFYAYGNNELTIGYNCWLGSAVILDTLGNLKVGNNVGIGSQVQIYSHAKFGDTLYGCRINAKKSIELGDDVWIAPGCVITMATLGSRSMLLAGSVLTKDTSFNHIYAGIPAIDISDKLGFQFDEIIDFNKVSIQLNKYRNQFYLDNPEFDKKLIEICIERPPVENKEISYFSVKDRKYTKRLSEVEMLFIKFLLPEKGKFVPYLK